MSMSDYLAGQTTAAAAALPVNPPLSLAPAFQAPSTVGPQFGGVGTDAYAQVVQLLDTMGLSDLAGWAQTQLTNGNTADEIALNLRQTPEWQQRFWMISQRQAEGKPPITEADVLNYERTAADLGRQYGMPDGFLDTKTVGNLIVNDWSPTELEGVLKDGYDAVAKADPYVRAWFQQTYGTKGDANLAAFFVDADKAEPLLIQQAQSAVLGGNAARYGIGLTQTQAMQLAQAGVTLSTAESGYQDINRLASLFQTDVGDTGPALDKAAGVSARLLGSASELDTEQQKLAARGAAAAGKVGVEENPQKGFEGLGAAS